MKINTTSAEKLTAAIAKVEGSRVSARTISASDISDAADRLEKQLRGMMFQKDWKGLKFKIDVHGQSFPSSYRGAPESTQFTIERGATGWFVIDICRTHACNTEVYPINIGWDDYVVSLANYAKSVKAWN